MKKFFTAALLSFALFAAPAYFAQTKGTEVPQNKVVATAKPFIGKWAAVSCEDSGPVGVRFSIRVNSVVDQENGARWAPVFKLTAIRNFDFDPFDLQTNSFQTVQNEDSKDSSLLLQVENDEAGMISLQPTKTQGKVLTSLFGTITNFRDGTETKFFVIPDTFKVENWDYVTPLSTLCSTDGSNHEPQA